jgi:uncharacterized protein YjbI with pentapeptide repeats
VDPSFTTAEPSKLESNTAELSNTDLTSAEFSKARLNAAKPFANQPLETCTRPTKSTQDRYHDTDQK